MAEKKLAKAGKWSASATWSPAGAPAFGDDVVLGSNAFELKIEATSKCRSLDCTGYTGMITGESALEIGEAATPESNIALKLVAGMTFSYKGDITFLSTSKGTAQKIFTGGKEVRGLTIKEKAGNYILEEGVTGSSVSTFAVEKEANLNVNGQTIKGFKAFNVNEATCKLGATTITCSVVSGKVLLATATETSAATIVLSGAKCAFEGGPNTYAVVTIEASAVKLVQSSTITTLNLNNAGAEEGTLFNKGTTITVGTITTNAKSGSLAFIHSSEEGKQFTLTKASGNVSLSFLKIQDSKVDASPTWTDLNGENISNNTNWIFESEGATTSGLSMLV